MLRLCNTAKFETLRNFALGPLQPRRYAELASASTVGVGTSAETSEIPVAAAYAALYSLNTPAATASRAAAANLSMWCRLCVYSSTGPSISWASNKWRMYLSDKQRGGEVR